MSLVRQLFRTKSLDDMVAETREEGHQLKKVLGPWNLVALGIGAIIGAGIFATIGTAAAGDAHRPGAGPALMLSFVLTAIVCGFSALCYAEFASMVPVAGSAYTYSYATLGELVAWIIGWDLIIEYAIGNVAVAISWANYFNTLLDGFGIHLPLWLTIDYRTAAAKMPALVASAPHIFGVPIVFNILAGAIVAAITVVLVWGIRESASFNIWMVGIKLVVLGFFVLASVKFVKPANWHPFAPNGFHGIATGAAIVFFAYIGFDAVSTTAEEARNPKRDMPIGIIGSLIICTIIYAAIAAVFTGMIPFPALTKTLASEQAEPRPRALLPRPGRYVPPPGSRRALLPRPGVLPPAEVVDALHRLARARPHRLRDVRPPPRRLQRAYAPRRLRARRARDRGVRSRAALRRARLHGAQRRGQRRLLHRRGDHPGRHRSARDSGRAAAARHQSRRPQFLAALLAAGAVRAAGHAGAERLRGCRRRAAPHDWPRAAAAGLQPGTAAARVGRAQA